MDPMPIVDLFDTAKQLGDSGKRVNVLWQQPDSLAFVARGREYRSEFHLNPSEELMYQIKGEMRLHYRTPEGKEEVAVINLLHEETFVVKDYTEDPVSKAYKNFFDSEVFRTCKKCGEVMPAPETM
jgi:3-hydroxyanthranilate 3,4-dioxygenase